MITTLPIVVLVIGIRIVLERFFSFTGVVDFSDLAPILTGGVFLVGLMLGGVLSDYKESEKIPSELACSLETMLETIRWAAIKPEIKIRPLVQSVVEVSHEIIDWFFHRRTYEDNYQAIERLNGVVKELDKVGTNPASRFLNELHNIRKLVTRIGVISRTGFLPSGYALLDTLVIAAIILTTLATFKSDKAFLGKYIILGFVPLIYAYMSRLIRDIEDPFEYSPDGVQRGAAEVELFPLLEYQKRAQEYLASLPNNA